jgi:hypothetical protein
MHHFIYPSKDTYITNQTNWDSKNFGLDEMLLIGTDNKPQRYLSPTKDYVYTNATFISQPFESFTGIFVGDFGGSVDYANGNISGSFLIFSASYFSGSIDGVKIVTSGSISGSLVNGYISGSVDSTLYVIGTFSGQLTGSSACMTGTGSGIDTRNEPNWTTKDNQFVNRALLKFDLTAISTSIANGTIINPSFSLKLKVCNEYDLPIDYTIYGFALNQSWNMGDGYFSDGGSDQGVSWRYRDYNGGTLWYVPSISGVKPSVDFLTYPSLLTQSFAYGGGTFYTTSICSQSFSYETSDINMDLTQMANAWLNGSMVNEGVILLSSDELNPNGYGFTLKFFSRDTNTIYSPYLDVAWSDFTFSTGSISTASILIATASAGISGTITQGSSFSIIGGVSGSFSGSAFINLGANYITASGQTFNYSAPDNSGANAVWYANNGYHFDSWYAAWDLDPYHGGFLPNTDIQMAPPPPDYGSPPVLQFTGSFTGSFLGTASYVNGTISGSSTGFYTDYFTGSVDNSVVELSASTISSSFIYGLITGSASSPTMLGFYIGQLNSPSIFLNGTGSGNYLDSTYFSLEGFTNGQGLSGNIVGVPVFGAVQGFLTQQIFLVVGPCGSSFSASLAKAVFSSGVWSGSAFTAYYVDYKFENACLTGSWPAATLLGTYVSIPLPSGIDPYAYATVSGLYVNGVALGMYVFDGPNSASFNGQFINGNLLGGFLHLQLSGSVYTSSYAYTSSVLLTSSVLTPLDVQRPFSVTLTNVHPQYKAGDVVKLYVFGRMQYPLKYFGISSQQEQYLVPQYLPSSSYYALKDNQTDEIVVNFDSYTQIGCEYPNGSFFSIDTTSLPQDRYYRVLIRIGDETDSYTIDTGKIFKLTR